MVDSQRQQAEERALKMKSVLVKTKKELAEAKKQVRKFPDPLCSALIYVKSKWERCIPLFHQDAIGRHGLSREHGLNKTGIALNIREITYLNSNYEGRSKDILILSLQLMEQEVTGSQLKGQLESATQQAEEYKVILFSLYFLSLVC